MAAAAFWSTLLFRCADGYRFSVRWYSTDVNNAYWYGAQGSTFTEIECPNSHGVVELYDFIVDTGGTDCKHSRLYVNGKDSGIMVKHTDNLNTDVNRAIAANPIRFQPGAKIALRNITA